jgi:hypothetical protein
VAKAEGRASLAECLRLGHGFAADERDVLIDKLGSLDHRLRSFRAEGTELELRVNDRDTAQQRMVLEGYFPRYGRIVATSALRDLDAAIHDVRSDMIRRLDDAKTRNEPRNNRQLRTP